MAEITKKRLSVAFALNAAVAGGIWYGINDHLHAPDTPSGAEVSVPVEDVPDAPPLRMTIEPDLPDTHIAEPISEPSMPTEVVETTLSSLCEAGPDHKREFCDIAMQVESITGWDATIATLKLGVETMFDRDFVAAGDRDTTHSAKGLWQMQPGYLVTEVMWHGHDLSFYPDLQDDDPLKLAIDRIRDEMDTGISLPRLQGQINEAIEAVRDEAGDPNLTEIEPELIIAKMTDPLEQALYAMVWDDVRAGELVGRAALKVSPESHVDNFTGSWEEELPNRLSIAEEVYGFHNQGGSIAYQFAIADNPDLRNIAPSNQAQLANALQVVSDLGPNSATILAEELAINAKGNETIFKQKDDTIIGCIRTNIRDALQLHTADIIDFPAKSTPASFMTDEGVNVTRLTWENVHCEDTITIPPMRPANFAETVAAAQAQASEGIGSTSAAPVTLDTRPRARPYSLRPGDSS